MKSGVNLQACCVWPLFCSGVESRKGAHVLKGIKSNPTELIFERRGACHAGCKWSHACRRSRYRSCPIPLSCSIANPTWALIQHGRPNQQWGVLGTVNPPGRLHENEMRGSLRTHKPLLSCEKEADKNPATLFVVTFEHKQTGLRVCPGANCMVHITWKDEQVALARRDDVRMMERRREFTARLWRLLEILGHWALCHLSVVPRVTRSRIKERNGTYAQRGRNEQTRRVFLVRNQVKRMAMRRTHAFGSLQVNHCGCARIFVLVWLVDGAAVVNAKPSLRQNFALALRLHGFVPGWHHRATVQLHLRGNGRRQILTVNSSGLIGGGAAPMVRKYCLNPWTIWSHNAL